MDSECWTLAEWYFELRKVEVVGMVVVVREVSGDIFISLHLSVIFIF